MFKTYFLTPSRKIPSIWKLVILNGIFHIQLHSEIESIAEFRNISFLNTKHLDDDGLFPDLLVNVSIGVLFCRSTRRVR